MICDRCGNKTNANYGKELGEILCYNCSTNNAEKSASRNDESKGLLLKSSSYYNSNVDKNSTKTEVNIVGMKIPFWDLVFLMVKISFAAIPAIFIIGFIWSVVLGVFANIDSGY
jgi:hypothetical protein